MKILYYYPEQDTFMFFWQRIHFLSELPKHGIEFEIFNPLLFDSLESAHNELYKVLDHGFYNLFFTSAPLFLNKEVLSKIKAKGIPSLCFRPDNLLIPYIDKDICRSFDLIWLSSKETAHFYKMWGAKFIFAPYGANPYFFQPVKNDHKNKICFIGSPYGSRSNIINTIVNHSINIDVYCKEENTNKNKELVPKYDIPRISTLSNLYNSLLFQEGRRVLLGNIMNRFTKHELYERECLRLLPKVPFEDLNKIYSSYSLSLSSTSARNTDVLKNPVPVVNLRAFEIPMAGGIQFCRYNEELAGYFEDGKEIVFYRNNEELVDKAKFYTENASEKKISDMKHAARMRAENDHTWMKRFALAFSELGIKY